MRAAGARVLAACALVALCASVAGCAQDVTVSDESPRVVSTSCAAGSSLTEDSQYVEARFTFDAPVMAADGGSVADDFTVLVNGEAPDARTIAVSAFAEGSEVVVRLAPTESGRSESVYFALYDGLVEVSPSLSSGALAHVLSAEGSANAVVDQGVSFTVPSGIKLSNVERAAGSVSFDVEQFAQLRTCAWFYFGEGLPLVKLHNHEFLRDLPQTCAQRLADTINTNYGDAFEAEADGAHVVVRAVGAADGDAADGEALMCAVVVEGLGANPLEGELGESEGEL